jgi:hypothetical protein
VALPQFVGLAFYPVTRRRGVCLTENDIGTIGVDFFEVSVFERFHVFVIFRG